LELKKTGTLIIVSAILALLSFGGWQLMAQADTSGSDNNDATAQDKSYTFSTKLVDTTSTGGALRFHIHAATGYVIKTGTPLLIRLRANPSLQLTHQKLGWEQAQLEQKRDLIVTGGYSKQESAKGTIKAQVKFAICDAESCQLVFERATFQIH
jgi:hypothetical protein